MSGLPDMRNEKGEAQRMKLQEYGLPGAAQRIRAMTHVCMNLPPAFAD
jgi:hypothetical protein